MTFTLPSDPDYLRAKSIKRGTTLPDPSYQDFLDQFGRRFGSSPLTISFDSIDRARLLGRTPRLAVALERTVEYQTFLADTFSYDEAKQQEVARLLTRTVDARVLRANFELPHRLLRPAPSPADIFVCFEDFERVATWEVHDLAAAGDLGGFTATLGLGQWFWCTQRFAGPPIVFVHTEEQAQTVRASPAPAEWADTYFEIAKRHDEFGYLERSSIAINVDSKENFDTHFSSNWYYYFK